MFAPGDSCLSTGREEDEAEKDEEHHNTPAYRGRSVPRQSLGRIMDDMSRVL